MELVFTNLLKYQPRKGRPLPSKHAGFVWGARFSKTVIKVHWEKKKKKKWQKLATHPFLAVKLGPRLCRISAFTLSGGIQDWYSLWPPPKTRRSLLGGGGGGHKWKDQRKVEAIGGAVESIPSLIRSVIESDWLEFLIDPMWKSNDCARPIRRDGYSLRKANLNTSMTH